MAAKKLPESHEHLEDQETQDPQEQEREELLQSEDELLQGLLEAAEGVEEQTVEIEIARRGKVLFRFRIRPLSDQEYEEAREKATVYTRNNLGIRIVQEVNTSRYRSWLIYKATVDEDRRRVWQNREAWKRLGVLSGVDMIDRVLFAGEKDAVVRKIDEISGYGAEVERQRDIEREREELAKN